MTAADDISEQTFLLTELRYTLGQLQVQLGDLEPEQRAAASPGQTSVDQILDRMITCERKYQSEYAHALHLSQSPEAGVSMSSEGTIPDRQARFDALRVQTIALLEQVQTWPAELVDRVKQQVMDDRRHTTEVAERRAQLRKQEQRPDLTEPLTRPE